MMEKGLFTSVWGVICLLTSCDPWIFSFISWHVNISLKLCTVGERLELFPFIYANHELRKKPALPICYTHMWIVLEREFLQTVNPLNNNSTNKKRFNNIRFCFMEHYNISALTRRGNVLMSTNSIMVNAAFVVKSNLHGRSIIPLSQYRT